MNRTYAVILATLTLMTALFFTPSPGWTQEKSTSGETQPETKAETKTKKTAPGKPLNFLYAPDHCEFEAKFPEEPVSSHRCDDTAGKRCYDLISYTQVYELSATVSFKVICNPIDKGITEQYTPEVMKATLKAMTQGKVLKSFDSSVREDAGYKQAGLVGEGLVGRTPTIYIAQLWIGQKSALSVEAELIGEPDDNADKLFSDILRTVRYRGDAGAGLKGEEDEKSTSEKTP